jgi:hypothetical protein
LPRCSSVLTSSVSDTFAAIIHYQPDEKESAIIKKDQAGADNVFRTNLIDTLLLDLLV